MHVVLHVMHVLMQKSDWMLGIGLPSLKVISFMDTGVDWICFYKDASKVDFGFLVIANMDWTIGW